MFGCEILFRALVGGIVLTASFAFAAKAESLRLEVGFTEVIRLEGAPRTITIGNPEIADVTVSSGNTLVLTGKAIGLTNLIVLDENGKELSTATVRVVSPNRQHITSRHGNKSWTYICDPGCELIERTSQEPSVSVQVPTAAATATTGQAR
jgi:hypothetical protein